MTLLSLFSMAPQENTKSPATGKVNELTIPVELAKSIKADKARPGDVVQFRMAEPVLVADGIVVPKKARLYGQVLLAQGAKNGKRSVLSLMVERAEWDGHVASLHAFVTGWGKRRVFEYPRNNCITKPNLIQPRSRGDPSPTAGPQWNVFDYCKPAAPIIERYEPAYWGHKLLAREINIYRNPADGSTVMVSDKNIRLPSGLLLILQNVGPTQPESAKR